LKILGLSAFYHDSAAALVVDGEIIAAAQEERFTRVKHDPRFPEHSIRYCVAAGGLRGDQIDRVVFYEKPLIKFERLLETYVSFAPRGFSSFRLAMSSWLGEKLHLRELLGRDLEQVDPALGKPDKLLFCEHHLSHAASAFFPSPFERAAILTLDGVGEWATTAAGLGEGATIDLKKEIEFPHSLGLLYSAFTYYCGFKVNSGEYKLMGLAPYGEPRFAQSILENLIDLKSDGSFRLNLNYFDYCSGLRMTNGRFDKLFGAPPRVPETMLDQRHMDLAASIQAVTNEAVARLARSTVAEMGTRNLCLAGGVALNCVANGKLLEAGVVDEIFIQPAAGDAGGAVGAALAAYHDGARRPRRMTSPDGMRGSYLGPSFDDEAIEEALNKLGARYDRLEKEGLIDRTARALADGKVVGWFQGRMEFGPRALGARSILADPRSPQMQKKLNLKIKYRESFRPFAPSVLAERAGEWFDLKFDSPYMLLVANVRHDRLIDVSPEDDGLFGIERLNVPRSQIPAVTHLDRSARVQTVHAQTNSLFHALIKRFDELTGCPMLVNTSFNVRGEPIVCSPDEAYRCFMATDMDLLAMGSLVLDKTTQGEFDKAEFTSVYEAD
jgi:carbamoyltransferase